MLKIVCGVVLTAAIGTTPLYAAKQAVTVKNKSSHSYNEKVILERYNQYHSLIQEASKRTGLPPEEIAAFIKIESTFNKHAINQQFKAKGLYQHLDGTWVRQKRLYAKQMGVPVSADVYNARASMLVGSAALAADRKYLAKHSNRHPSQIKSGDLYLSHMYGYTRALKIIKAPKGTKISRFVAINPSSGLTFHKNKRIMTTEEFRMAANAKLEREKRLFINARNKNIAAGNVNSKKVKNVKGVKDNKGTVTVMK